MCRIINFEAYDDNDNKNAYLVSFGKKTGWRAYVDGQYGYVYAQTERELLNLVSAVDDEADRMGTREATNIYIASPAYWPLPWYLRRYNGAAFAGNLPEGSGISAISQPLMIANQSQTADIEAAGGWRAATPAMALRPGEQLVLFVRDGDRVGQCMHCKLQRSRELVVEIKSPASRISGLCGEYTDH